MESYDFGPYGASVSLSTSSMYVNDLREMTRQDNDEDKSNIAAERFQQSTPSQGQFQCREGCDKTFRSSASRDRHENHHTKRIAFPRTQCSKVFYRIDVLKAHKFKEHKIVGEERSQNQFQCRQGCEKTFKNSSTRDRHEKSHTREAIFPCTRCSRAFNRIDMVKAHIVKDHGIIGEVYKPDLKRGPETGALMATKEEVLQLTAELEAARMQLDQLEKKCEVLQQENQTLRQMVLQWLGQKFEGNDVIGMETDMDGIGGQQWSQDNV